MDNVDKIVISSDKTHCMVYFINGPCVKFIFFKIGVPYYEFVEWFEGATGVRTKAA